MHHTGCHPCPRTGVTYVPGLYTVPAPRKVRIHQGGPQKTTEKEPVTSHLSARAEALAF